MLRPELLLRMQDLLWKMGRPGHGCSRQSSAVRKPLGKEKWMWSRGEGRREAGTGDGQREATCRAKGTGGPHAIQTSRVDGLGGTGAAGAGARLAVTAINRASVTTRHGGMCAELSHHQWPRPDLKTRWHPAASWLGDHRTCWAPAARRLLSFALKYFLTLGIQPGSPPPHGI